MASVVPDLHPLPAGAAGLKPAVTVSLLSEDAALRAAVLPPELALRMPDGNIRPSLGSCSFPPPQQHGSAYARSHLLTTSQLTVAVNSW